MAGGYWWGLLVSVLISTKKEPTPIIVRWRGQGNNGSRRRAGAWSTGAKAVMARVLRLGSGITNPLRSRSCHQEKSKFHSNSQDSGNPVVNSVCRDSADGL